MKNEERLIIDGYRFLNDNDAKLATEEKKKIAYLETKLNYENIDVALKIYEKVIKEKVFKTPIGIEYLIKIRSELMRKGIPEERIPAIPLTKNYSVEEDKRPVRILQVKEAKDNNKELLRASLWLNIGLFLLVIGMLFITLMGENTNMLNYRYKLENDYAIWEQELQEREAKVLEKERELNIKE